MESFLKKLVEVYPEQGADIVRLAGTDEWFRSICEEIELAETARAHWNGMPDRVREYEDILEGLKKEFWTQLQPSSR